MQSWMIFIDKIIIEIILYCHILAAIECIEGHETLQFFYIIFNKTLSKEQCFYMESLLAS